MNCKTGQRRRRRELLELDLVLAAHRVGRQFARQRLQRADRRADVHAADQLGNGQGERDFQRFETVALLPGTCGVIAACTLGHGLAQSSAVDRNSEEQLGGKCARSAENGAGARNRCGHAEIS
jgi:hypothetical protein